MVLTGVAAVFSKKAASPRSILVVKHDAIGDMVYALPAIHALHATYPQAAITVWCKDPAAQLLQEDATIHEIVTLPHYPKGPFDVEVELRPSWQSLQYRLLEGPIHRVGRGAVRWRNRGAQLHEVQTNLQIVQPLLKEKPATTLTIQVSGASRARVEAFRQRLGLLRYAVVHPGASLPLKRWPVARFATVVDELLRNGLQVVVCGSIEEKMLVEQVRLEATGYSYHACGLFSLMELAELLRGATLFVGNDSGPLHIAAAMGCPTVGLFGPVAPGIFYPPANNCRVLHAVLPCTPCDQVHCVHAENPCIQRIAVGQVTQAIARLLHT